MGLWSALCGCFSGAGPSERRTGLSAGEHGSYGAAPAPAGLSYATDVPSGTQEEPDLPADPAARAAQQPTRHRSPDAAPSPGYLTIVEVRDQIRPSPPAAAVAAAAGSNRLTEPPNHPPGLPRPGITAALPNRATAVTVAAAAAAAASEADGSGSAAAAAAASFTGPHQLYASSSSRQTPRRTLALWGGTHISAGAGGGASEEALAAVAAQYGGRFGGGVPSQHPGMPPPGMADAAAFAVATVASINPMPARSFSSRHQGPIISPALAAAVASAAQSRSRPPSMPTAAAGVAPAGLRHQTAAALSSLAMLPADLPAQAILDESSTVSISSSDENDDGLPSPTRPGEEMEAFRSRSVAFAAAAAAGPGGSLRRLAAGPGAGGGGGATGVASPRHLQRNNAEEAAFIRGTLAALKQATLAGFQEHGEAEVLPGLPRIWSSHGSHRGLAAAAPPSVTAAPLTAGAGSPAATASHGQTCLALHAVVHDANLAAVFGSRSGGAGAGGLGAAAAAAAVAGLLPLTQALSGGSGVGGGGAWAPGAAAIGGAAPSVGWLPSAAAAAAAGCAMARPISGRQLPPLPKLAPLHPPSQPPPPQHHHHLQQQQQWLLRPPAPPAGGAVGGGQGYAEVLQQIFARATVAQQQLRQQLQQQEQAPTAPQEGEQQQALQGPERGTSEGAHASLPLPPPQAAVPGPVPVSSAAAAAGPPAAGPSPPSTTSTAERSEAVALQTLCGDGMSVDCTATAGDATATAAATVVATDRPASAPLTTAFVRRSLPVQSAVRSGNVDTAAAAGGSCVSGAGAAAGASPSGRTTNSSSVGTSKQSTGEVTLASGNGYRGLGSEVDGISGGSCGDSTAADATAALPAAATAPEAEVAAFAQRLGSEQREALAQLVREKWSPFSFPLLPPAAPPPLSSPPPAPLPAPPPGSRRTLDALGLIPECSTVHLAAELAVAAAMSAGVYVSHGGGPIAAATASSIGGGSCCSGPGTSAAGLRSTSSQAHGWPTAAQPSFDSPYSAGSSATSGPRVYHYGSGLSWAAVGGSTAASGGGSGVVGAGGSLPPTLTTPLPRNQYASTASTTSSGAGTGLRFAAAAVAASVGIASTSVLYDSSGAASGLTVSPSLVGPHIRPVRPLKLQLPPPTGEPSAVDGRASLETYGVGLSMSPLQQTGVRQPVPPPPLTVQQAAAAGHAVLAPPPPPPHGAAAPSPAAHACGPLSVAAAAVDPVPVSMVTAAALQVRLSTATPAAPLSGGDLEVVRSLVGRKWSPFFDLEASLNRQSVAAAPAPAPAAAAAPSLPAPMGGALSAVAAPSLQGALVHPPPGHHPASGSANAWQLPPPQQQEQLQALPYATATAVGMEQGSVGVGAGQPPAPPPQAPLQPRSGALSAAADPVATALAGADLEVVRSLVGRKWSPFFDLEASLNLSAPSALGSVSGASHGSAKTESSGAAALGMLGRPPLPPQQQPRLLAPPAVLQQQLQQQPTTMVTPTGGAVGLGDFAAASAASAAAGRAAQLPPASSVPFGVSTAIAAPGGVAPGAGPHPASAAAALPAAVAELPPEAATPAALSGADLEVVRSLVGRKWSPFFDLEASLNRQSAGAVPASPPVLLPEQRPSCPTPSPTNPTEAAPPSLPPPFLPMASGPTPQQQLEQQGSMTFAAAGPSLREGQLAPLAPAPLIGAASPAEPPPPPLAPPAAAATEPSPLAPSVAALSGADLEVVRSLVGRKWSPFFDLEASLAGAPPRALETAAVRPTPQVPWGGEGTQPGPTPTDGSLLPWTHGSVQSSSAGPHAQQALQVALRGVEGERALGGDYSAAAARSTGAEVAAVAVAAVTGAAGEAGPNGDPPGPR